MKKYLLGVVSFCLAMAVGAQSVAIKDIDPSSLDLTKADLSQTGLFFQGPLQLYVSGLRYAGDGYAAILDYDGGYTVEVRVPDAVTTEGKPRAVDLTQARLRITATGLRLENVVAEGRMYAADMEITPSNQLVVRSLIPGELVPSTDELNAQVASLQTAAKQQDERIDRLNRQIATTGDAQAQELRRQINALETQIQQKDTQIARLQPREAASPDWATASTRLTRVLLSGFGSGSALTGAWERSTSSASQTDQKRLNAKLTIPLVQNSDELLYSFRGSASGSGWLGFGLHFLASGSLSRDSYGFGQSYLVWLTRDPAHYQNPQTYVQLYKSFDDVRMVELASKAVDASIDAGSEISVHVNRSSRVVTVILGGEPVVSYHDPNMIQRGDQAAMRALGAAVVRNLEVRSR